MTATIASTLHTGYAGSIFRPLIGVALGLVVTASLFWFMQYLIETADHSLDHEKIPTILEFVRVERDETVKDERIKKPKVPEKLDEQPPQLEPPTFEDPNVTVHEVAVPDVPIDTGPGRNKGFDIGGEGDYLPIVKVSPVYPTRALQRGIEGHCIVEYTVTRFGTTRDVVVIADQCTSSLFHKASIAAALKFKYKPRVVDGVEIEVPGVRNLFTYEITE